jgi:hypothetical protein
MSKDFSLVDIKLGDGEHRSEGWLVVVDGAVRAIVTRGNGSTLILNVACDVRLGSKGPVFFDSLRQLKSWLSRRLGDTSAAEAAQEPCFTAPRVLRRPGPLAEIGSAASRVRRTIGLLPAPDAATGR